MGSNPAHNTRIDWIEENEIPDTLVIGATESSAGTSITVVANAYTAVNDSVLFNTRTYDCRRVNAVPASDTALTVAISEGGTTSAVWNAGDVIHVLPPALPENDAEYRLSSVVSDNVYNYVHLMKLQYALTRVVDKVHTIDGGAGSKRSQLKRQKYREFRKKLEKLLYFGGRATSGDANYTELRMMGGLTHYLRNGTLYKDFNGIMTESGLRSFLGDYKDQNPDSSNVMIFAAGNVLDIISNFGRSALKIAPESKTYGLDIWNYISRGLRAKLVALPLLTDAYSRGWGWILDMERLKIRWLDPPKFYPEALNVGESENIIDTYRGVVSMLIGNESRHAMFVGAKL